MILLTGATGNVGGHLLGQLTGLAAPVRALVRSEEKADALRGYDCEIAVGSYDQPASLDAALRGVERIFLLSPAGPRMAEQEGALVDAALAAGSSPHVVKLAAAGVDVPDADIALLRAHREVIEHLAGSGLPTTVLGPSSFMQNLLGHAASIQEQGAFYLPAGEAAVSHVDARDVAAVAAHVLTSDGHEGETYTVTGPEALTYAQVAEKISVAVGKQVQYVAVPDDAARSAMVSAGLSSWLADGLVELNAAYRAGAGAVVTDEVQKATGRPARSLDDFLAAHAGAFR